MSGTTAAGRHVAHVNTNTDWGGGENQVFNLVTRLMARGVPCTLFAARGGALWARASAAGVPVEGVPRFAAGWRLGRRLRAIGADLVHVHDSAALSLGGAAGRRAALPVVLSRRIASSLRRNWRSRRKYSKARLAAVIAISETVRGVVAESGYPAERIHVAPSGLDFARLDAVAGDPVLRGECGGGFLVGGIGKLSVKKNWSLMLRTAARLQQDGLDIRWVLVGDGPERTRLERLAHELGVAERVRFLGFREDALRLLKTFDLLFFPSIMEGASVTVREAMALAVPVVAVNAPGTVESLGGFGWTVEAADVEGAAARVRQALLDEPGRREMARRARESARQRFAFERTVDDTLRVYEKVLGRDFDA